VTVDDGVTIIITVGTVSKKPSQSSPPSQWAAVWQYTLSLAARLSQKPQTTSQSAWPFDGSAVKSAFALLLPKVTKGFL